MRYVLFAVTILGAFVVFAVVPIILWAPPPWVQRLGVRIARARLRRLARDHPGLVAQAHAGCLDGHPPSDVDRIMHPTRDVDVFLCDRCNTIFEEKPHG